MNNIHSDFGGELSGFELSLGLIIALSNEMELPIFEKNAEFRMLNVIPGYRCTQECGHCINKSGPNRKEHLSISEIKSLKSVIQKYSFREIMFSGGEPTLYIDQINEISREIRGEQIISITTNGWFFCDQQTTEKTLKLLERIDRIYLSVDLFHRPINIEILLGVKAILKKRNIEMLFRATVSHPMEAIKFEEMARALDVRVILQRLGLGGRARDTNLNYSFIEFEKDVLNSHCPNLKTLSFIQGKGFSNCCSNLIFDFQTEGISSPDLESYLISDFYQELKSNTFGELVRKYLGSEYKFLPEDSDPCVLCEKVYGKRMCS